jgi:hypothetical protein
MTATVRCSRAAGVVMAVVMARSLGRNVGKGGRRNAEARERALEC